MANPLRPRSSDAIIGIVRRVLLLILLLAMIGILVELLLVEHFEDVWQFVPLCLLGLGLATLAWHAWAPSRASRRVLEVLMVAFMLAGFLGFYFHYRGNAEFELEENPNIPRWELFREAMMGGTPALAPGIMIQIGLIGLLYAFVSGPSKSSEGRL